MLTHANTSELNDCYDILDSGREFQKKQGFVQWDNEYPTLNLVEELCKQKDVYYIRIDTDFPNKRMQHVFIKNGFKECGVINFKGPKKVYDKILEKKQQ